MLLLSTEFDEYLDCLVQKTHTPPKSWKWIEVMFAQYCGSTCCSVSKSCRMYKKDLHDPDNHSGLITHLEPDILKCEDKWALDKELDTA